MNSTRFTLVFASSLTKAIEKLKRECETKKKRYKSTMKAAFAIATGIEKFEKYNVKMTEGRAKLEYDILWEKFNREEEQYEYVILARRSLNT